MDVKKRRQIAKIIPKSIQKKSQYNPLHSSKSTGIFLYVECLLRTENINSNMSFKFILCAEKVPD